MLSVGEAQAIIQQHAQPLPPEHAPLSAATLGLILAEEIASDLEMPPYTKALMDGFAVRCVDLPDGQARLHVIEEILAGQMPRLPLGPGQASRIMTGAPLPAGADAVIMVEHTEMLDGQQVQVHDRPPRPGQNILERGREMRCGEMILPHGTVLRPQEFGLLATVGRSTVQVHPRPRVAVISTGDEVVEPTQTPGPGQIRNGNGTMLLAQAARAGGAPHFLGIARDRLESLRPLIGAGLEAPVLVLSGGVSAGKRDLVPEVLRDLGVEAHFHKVAMKPGKPVLFGTRGSTLVFGLPGNPVSAFVCFELFVRPALRRLLGHAEPGPTMISAALAEDFAYPTDRPTYYPASLEACADGWRVHPVAWFGSADLRGLAQANALAFFPAGKHQHPQGERVAVIAVER